MKKKVLYILPLLSLVALSGCSKEVAVADPKATVTTIAQAYKAGTVEMPEADSYGISSDVSAEADIALDGYPSITALSGKIASSDKAYLYKTSDGTYKAYASSENSFEGKLTGTSASYLSSEAAEITYGVSGTASAKGEISDKTYLKGSYDLTLSTSSGSTTASSSQKKDIYGYASQTIKDFIDDEDDIKTEIDAELADLDIDIDVDDLFADDSDFDVTVTQNSSTKDYTFTIAANANFFADINFKMTDATRTEAEAELISMDFYELQTGTNASLSVALKTTENYFPIGLAFDADFSGTTAKLINDSSISSISEENTYAVTANTLKFAFSLGLDIGSEQTVTGFTDDEKATILSEGTDITANIASLLENGELTQKDL